MSTDRANNRNASIWIERAVAKYQIHCACDFAISGATVFVPSGRRNFWRESLACRCPKVISEHQQDYRRLASSTNRKSGSAVLAMMREQVARRKSQSLAAAWRWPVIWPRRSG